MIYWSAAYFLQYDYRISSSKGMSIKYEFSKGQSLCKENHPQSNSAIIESHLQINKMVTICFMRERDSKISQILIK